MFLCEKWLGEESTRKIEASKEFHIRKALDFE